MTNKQRSKEQIEDSPFRSAFEDIGTLIAGNQTIKDGRTLREARPGKYEPKTLFGHFIDGVVKRAIHDAKIKHDLKAEEGDE